ncbi:Uncharacterised protein [uncultured archaeon]|nr:Uncharacterised protein [uncultured archaeon]
MKNILTDQPDRTPVPTDKKGQFESPVANELYTEQVIKGLKIDNMLYCLDTGKEKYLFATEDEAIDQLRKLDRKNINPDNSQIVQVATTGNAWKLTQVPWSHIAVKLL